MVGHAVINDALSRLAQRYDNHDDAVARSAVATTLASLADVVEAGPLGACRAACLAAIEKQGAAKARATVGTQIEALGNDMNDQPAAPADADEED